MKVVLLVSLCLVLATAALYLRAHRRFARLARDMAAGGTVDSADSPERMLLQRRDTIVKLRAQVQNARVQREEVERQVAAHQARFAAAVQGVHDGLWEWNLATGEAYYSAGWKNLLGHAETDIGQTFDEWLSRVHPEERDLVNGALVSHMNGTTPRLEIEHRVRHRDGSWRWMLARASALRSPSGEPYRLVGLTTDVSARHKAAEDLLQVADALSTLSGQDCCAVLVRKLAQIVGAPEAFLCVCADRPPTRVRMLARWTAHGETGVEDFELDGTPCREVIAKGRTVFLPSGAQHRWPREYAECRTEAYLGLPCFDALGQVIGHIACKSQLPLHPDLPHQAVLKLFALRASVELARAYSAQDSGTVAVA